MSKQVRKLTEGAMIVAIVGVLLAIDRYTAGLVETLLFWALPIPVVLYTVKYGWRDGAVVAASVVLMSMIISTPQMSVLLFFSVISGYIYGGCLYQNINLVSTLILAFIVTFIYNYISTYLFAAFFGVDLYEEAIVLAELLYSFPLFDTIALKLTLDQIIDFVLMLMPVVLLILSVLQTLLIHMMSIILLNRLHIKKIQMYPISQIVFPKGLGMITMAIMVVSYTLLGNPNLVNYQPFLVTSGAIASFIFIIFGMILILIYAQYKDYRLLPICAVFLLFLAPYIIIILGVVDVFTNLRSNIVRRIIHDRENR